MNPKPFVAKLVADKTCCPLSENKRVLFAVKNWLVKWLHLFLVTIHHPTKGLG